MIDELDHLYRKGVSQHHIECLRKFDSLKGQMITDSRRLRGAKGGIKIPSDHIVTNPYYLHSLIRGVYKPESDPFALSIQTNPNSKWGKEIDGLEYANWQINYDFEDDGQYSWDMNSLELCHRYEVPIGIIFKTKKANNLILGLGIIQKVSGILFEIVPYEIQEKGMVRGVLA